MIQTKIDFQDVNGYINAAKQGADKLADWGAKVTKTVQKGGTLSTVESIINDMKIFEIASVASPVFAAASGGLMILGFLMGVKDKEDQMLEKMDTISCQISSLSDQLDDIYNKLVNEMDKHTALQEICHSVRELDTIKDSVDLYCKHVMEKKDTSQDELSFQQGHIQDILEDVKTIVTATTAGQIEAQYNLLQSVYDTSYGRFENILSYSNYLLRYAMLGVYLYSFYIAYYSKRDRTVLELLQGGTNEVIERFGDSIENMKNAIQNYLVKCRDNISDNATRFIDENFNHKELVDNVDKYQNLCNRMVDSLAAQWPMFDWMSTINDDAVGYSNHGIAGPHNNVEWWHKPFGTAKRNVILTIAWIDKEAPIVDKNSLKAIAKYYVNQTVRIEGIFMKTAEKVSDGDMQNILNVFLKDPNRPHGSTLRLCWHDLNLKASCNNASRLFVDYPTVKVDVNGYGQPIYNAFYTVLIFA